MDRQAYYGHESQLFGVEEHRLVGGRGDGMRLLQVRNGLGLEFTVSADRGCDISRLSWKGDNYGFFSANGYVGPAYYDDRDAGWMKGFTAGFLTTCGLLNVGAPCVDEGEALGQHGSISHTPQAGKRESAPLAGPAPFAPPPMGPGIPQDLHCFHQKA